MSTRSGKQLPQAAATSGTERSGEARAPGSPVHTPLASIAAPAARRDGTSILVLRILLVLAAFRGTERHTAAHARGSGQVCRRGWRLRQGRRRSGKHTLAELEDADEAQVASGERFPAQLAARARSSSGGSGAWPGDMSSRCT
jgi:hypothetical protein